MCKHKYQLVVDPYGMYNLSFVCVKCDMCKGTQTLSYPTHQELMNKQSEMLIKLSEIEKSASVV